MHEDVPEAAQSRVDRAALAGTFHSSARRRRDAGDGNRIGRSRGWRSPYLRSYRLITYEANVVTHLQAVDRLRPRDVTPQRCNVLDSKRASVGMNAPELWLIAHVFRVRGRCNSGRQQAEASYDK